MKENTRMASAYIEKELLSPHQNATNIPTPIITFRVQNPLLISSEQLDSPAIPTNKTSNDNDAR